MVLTALRLWVVLAISDLCNQRPQRFERMANNQDCSLFY